MSNQPKKDPKPNELCKEVSGFLFSHPCEQYARYICPTCGKPICPQHVEYIETTAMCISCAKTGGVPRNPKQGMPKPGEDRPVIVDNRMDNDDYDPYWYADDHYDNYSWRAHRFTEADESVLMQQGDDTEWENDLGAS